MSTRCSYLSALLAVTAAASFSRGALVEVTASGIVDLASTTGGPAQLADVEVGDTFDIRIVYESDTPGEELPIGGDMFFLFENAGTPFEFELAHNGVSVFSSAGSIVQGALDATSNYVDFVGQPSDPNQQFGVTFVGPFALSGGDGSALAAPLPAEILGAPAAEISWYGFDPNDPLAPPPYRAFATVTTAASRFVPEPGMGVALLIVGVVALRCSKGGHHREAARRSAVQV